MVAHPCGAARATRVRAPLYLPVGGTPGPAPTPGPGAGAPAAATTAATTGAGGGATASRAASPAGGTPGTGAAGGSPGAATPVAAKDTVKVGLVVTRSGALQSYGEQYLGGFGLGLDYAT